MAQFKPGHIPLSHRQKGSGNKPYLTIDYWYKELMKDWPKLRPQQRSKLATQLMQMITNKLKTMPGTPEQSVINAKEAQELLEGLEGHKAGKVEIDGSESSVTPSTPKPPEKL